MMSKTMNEATQSDPGRDFIRYRDDGDFAAFDAIMDRFHKPLYVYLYRMLGRAEEAEDALQEVWLKVIAQQDKYRDEGRFTAWIYRIAHNHCLDLYRKSKRFVQAYENDDENDSTPIVDRLAAEGPTPLETALENEDMQQIENAVGMLPPLIREVYLLRAVEEVPFKEIAVIQDAPLGTVLSRMSQAVKGIQKQLSASASLAEETA